jgi:allantoin racemase
VLITVVNPNTTAAMTDVIARAAAAVAAPGTVIRAVTPPMGPASIESHYDEALAAPGVLAEVAAGERAGSDGYVVACFGDPALDAARELARGPVVGIAEAAMHVAVLLGRTFSVVTSLGRTAGRARDLADRYGAGRACLGVHAVDVPVLELHGDGSGAPDPALLARFREAVASDGPDVVVLGCAALAPQAPALSAALGVPVVDGVAAATLLVQSLVTMRLLTAKRDEYAPPPAKPYTGALAPFGRQAAGVP